MRDFSEPIDDLDLIDAVYTRTQTAMHAKYLVIDHDGEGEEIEHVGEVVPNVGVAVFAVAFGVEAVGLCYASGLVVASDQVHARGVAQFEADEEGDCFDGKETAVYIVAWLERDVSDSVVVLKWKVSCALSRTWPKRVFVPST